MASTASCASLRVMAVASTSMDASTSTANSAGSAISVRRRALRRRWSAKRRRDDRKDPRPEVVSVTGEVVQARSDGEPYLARDVIGVARLAGPQVPQHERLVEPDDAVGRGPVAGPRRGQDVGEVVEMHHSHTTVLNQSSGHDPVHRHPGARDGRDQPSPPPTAAPQATPARGDGSATAPRQTRGGHNSVTSRRLRSLETLVLEARSHATRGVAREGEYASVQRRGEGSGGAPVRRLREELGTDHGTVQRVESQLGCGVESVRWVRDRDVVDGVAGSDALMVQDLERGLAPAFGSVRSLAHGACTERVDMAASEPVRGGGESGDVVRYFFTTWKPGEGSHDRVGDSGCLHQAEQWEQHELREVPPCPT